MFHKQDIDDFTCVAEDTNVDAYNDDSVNNNNPVSPIAAAI